MINGFRFHTRETEKKKRTTQNSRVIVIAKIKSFPSSRDKILISGDVTFYGILTDIIKFDYSMRNRVVVFKCDWTVKSGIRKEKDCITVNFSKLMSDDKQCWLKGLATLVVA